MGADVSHQPEHELIELAKAGDQEAFDELWSRYQEPLLGVIKSSATEVPFHEAEGYLGKLYLIVRRRIAGYRPEDSSFMGFLRYTARREQWRYLNEDREPGPKRPKGGGSGQGPGGNFSVRSLDDPDRPGEPADRQDSTDPASRLFKRQLWTRIFALDSPPHQLIVFGFNRLLQWTPAEIAGSRRTARPTAAGSAEGPYPKAASAASHVPAAPEAASGRAGPSVTDDLWIRPLRKLRDLLERPLYADEYEPPADSALAPLTPKMDQSLDTVLTQARDRGAYKALLQKLTGDLALEDYAEATSYPTPEENVTRWVANVIRALVQRRVLDEFRPSMRESAAGGTKKG